MKISRRGTSSDFGESNIEFKSPKFAWSKPDSCITIAQSGVRDFSTTSRHNYTVQLTLPEVQGFVQALADAAMAEPELFEKQLERSLKALVRIQAVVAGVKT